jgi:hypothetical protein
MAFHVGSCSVEGEEYAERLFVALQTGMTANGQSRHFAALRSLVAIGA